MRIRKLRTAVGVLSSLFALLLAGCRPAQPTAPLEAKPAPETANVWDEARGIAEASLGKQAEVLARGNLAQNGREQLLVVNRWAKDTQSSEKRTTRPAIFVTRAAVLEKNDGKWSQVLLCDEHLKNPYGYLGGSRALRASGWRLEYRQDPGEGLVMKFTPADKSDTASVNAEESSEEKVASFDVRWNKNAKRYQSFDQSHERYLSEVPSLETPQSILK